MPVPSRFAAYLLLTASMALVGSYVALSKPLVAVLPVFALAFLRFAIGAVAMIPWTPRTRGEAPLSASERRWLFLMSFFGNFLFSVCMLTGIAMTTATAAGVILATLPAVVALLSRLFLREHLAPRTLLAIALAVGGIVLLQFAKASDAVGARQALLGNLLMFGAVVCEASYVILGKRLAATRTPLRVSALINLWGLALTAPLGLWQLLRADLGAMTGGLWTLLLFYSLAAGLFSVDVGVRTEARARQPRRGVHGRAADRGHRGRRPVAGRDLHGGARRSTRARRRRCAIDCDRAARTDASVGDGAFRQFERRPPWHRMATTPRAASRSGLPPRWASARSPAAPPPAPLARRPGRRSPSRTRTSR
jgi:drug/metabolite transporter (DMT)-like permease